MWVRCCCAGAGVLCGQRQGPDAAVRPQELRARPLCHLHGAPSAFSSLMGPLTCPASSWDQELGWQEALQLCSHEVLLNVMLLTVVLWPFSIVIAYAAWQLLRASQAMTEHGKTCSMPAKCTISSAVGETSHWGCTTWLRKFQLWVCCCRLRRKRSSWRPSPTWSSAAMASCWCALTHTGSIFAAKPFAVTTSWLRRGCPPLLGFSAVLSCCIGTGQVGARDKLHFTGARSTEICGLDVTSSMLYLHGTREHKGRG